MAKYLVKKIGTAPIIIDRLSRCIQALSMPPVLRPGAIGSSLHPISKGNYQECVAEVKGGLRQRLRCPKDYNRRNFLKIWIYCSTSNNQ